MKEYKIGANDAGQRLDRFITKTVPLLPPSLMQKYIRTKRIKLDGKAAKKDARLTLGSTVQLYINDEFFGTPSRDNTYLGIVNASLDIIYEDDNIIICDKAAGMLSHPAEGSGESLLDHIKAYIYQNGQWKPREENSFSPAICNRLDRNTGGLVIAAKNAPALRIINEKLKNREIDKYYLCAVHGHPEKEEGKLEGFVVKDSRNNKVSISDTDENGGKLAQMEYRVLESKGDLSLVECRLITGRTHQIRAMMAKMGHPLLGDVKYGGKNRNNGGQALWAYRLDFNFTGDADVLNYLKGRSIIAGKIEFVEKEFNFHF